MDLPFAPEWPRLLLKAAFGSGLFTLILWCAQSRNPRAAGMMLTFPAVNGIGLLTAETDALFLMVQAMPPMIALNGLLCTIYILLQRQRSRQTAGMPAQQFRLGVLGICLLIWLSIAFWVAPALQSYVDSTRPMLVFIGAYTACSIPITVLLLWCPTTAPRPGHLSLGQVLRTNALRVSSVGAFLILLMLLTRHGAEAWAGRLSALPLLPFASLLVLSSMPSGVASGPSRLDQVGSTVLGGPLIAIIFAWVYAHYLQALRAAGSTTLTTILAVLGLLGLWGLCGLTIWGLLCLARRLEAPASSRAVSQR